MDGWKKSLEFEAYAEISKDTAIAASCEFNGLFEVDTASQRCTYLGMFPEERTDAERLYTKALYAEEKVYFVPAAANNLAVYQTADRSLNMIPVKEVNADRSPWYRKSAKFNGGIRFDSYIFLTPCTYPGIIRIDTATDEVKYFNDWVTGEAFIFRKAPVRYHKSFFVSCIFNNSVLEFNMESCKGKLWNVGKDNNGSWCLCRKEDELWLSPKNPGAVIRWNPVTGHVEEYKEYPSGFQENKFCFTKAFVRRDSIFLIPAYANMMVQVNGNTGKMSRAKFLELAEGSVVSFMFETPDAIYLKITCGNARQYFRLFTEKLILQKYNFIFSEGKKDFEQEYFFNTGLVLKEKYFFGLGNFMNAVNISKCSVSTMTETGSIGKRIFEEGMKWLS